MAVSLRSPMRHAATGIAVGLGLVSIVVQRGTTDAGRQPRGEALIAVAANFTATAAALADSFHRSNACTVVVSAGSSGTLYAQIRNGAPYDAFLSADTLRPARLEQEGLAVPKSRFTYAYGRLALWAPQSGGQDGESWLRDEAYRHLAIAMPSTAPYGAAAEQVLHRLGIYALVAHKVVRGESVAQTYQFVASHNAQLGFLAYAQVRREPATHVWLVDHSLYDPIRQDAVLLKRASNNTCVAQFLDFVRSELGRRIIERHGYATGPE